jgi:hypothetical protein
VRRRLDAATNACQSRRDPGTPHESLGELPDRVASIESRVVSIESRVASVESRLGSLDAQVGQFRRNTEVFSTSTVFTIAGAGSLNLVAAGRLRLSSFDDLQVSTDTERAT